MTGWMVGKQEESQAQEECQALEALQSQGIAGTGGITVTGEMAGTGWIADTGGVGGWADTYWLITAMADKTALLYRIKMGGTVPTVPVIFHGHLSQKLHEDRSQSDPYLAFHLANFCLWSQVYGRIFVPLVPIGIYVGF